MFNHEYWLWENVRTYGQHQRRLKRLYTENYDNASHAIDLLWNVNYRKNVFNSDTFFGVTNIRKNVQEWFFRVWRVPSQNDVKETLYELRDMLH